MECARANPPRVERGEALQIWVWRFHNFVNHRLGKPFVPFNVYQEVYEDEMAKAARDQSCGLW